MIILCFAINDNINIYFFGIENITLNNIAIIETSGGYFCFSCVYLLKIVNIMNNKYHA